MTELPVVRPFAGMRYRQADLTNVLAPPYDVIGPEQQQRLHERDSHNVVRLELGYGDGDERYVRSAAALQQWRREGVLIHDEAACIYAHSHTFTLHGKTWTRTGVLCAVRLTPFEDKIVLAHEGTLAKAREDRRRLILACEAQISPVFMMHSDPEGEAAKLIAEMMAAEPIARGELDGDTHVLWREPAGELTKRYCELTARGPLFIADGHHRYETALAVSREMKQKYPDASDDAAFNHALVVLCPAEQPGMIILPTHRVLMLSGAEQRKQLDDVVAKHFRRQPLECETSRAGEALRALVQAPTSLSASVVFGMYTREGGCSRLEVKPEHMPRDPGPGGIEELSTVLIHRLVIDPVLGADSAGKSVNYVSDEADAVRRVDEGSADCALFLRPTTVEQVERVAMAGLRMPGKSTYFYPKAPTGLVMSDIDPGRIIP